MKILVGLGNPGNKHRLNRHNLGFLVVDAWVLLKGAEFHKTEFEAETAHLKFQGEDVLVMKPQTFMNRSAEAVGSALRYYKASLEDILVVHDELDIPSMTFRIKKGGGHGGNNGLRSFASLGDNFQRIRMGIGRPPHPGMDVADFVLGNLSEEELNFWQEKMVDVCEAIDLCLSGKAEIAMNRFHRKGS